MHSKMKILAGVLLSMMVLPTIGPSRAATPAAPVRPVALAPLQTPPAVPVPPAVPAPPAVPVPPAVPAPPAVPGRPAAPAPPATQPADPASDLEEKLLPLIDTQSIRLTDFLEFIHSSVPAFQYIVVRDPGVSSDYPTLPSMKLEKMTLGQVLQVIQDIYPLVDFHVVSSNHGAALYVFKIHVGSAEGMGEVPQSVLKVYRLTEAVELLVSRNPVPIPPELQQHPDADRIPLPAKEKAEAAYEAALKAAHTTALNSLLSLIKAVLAQWGDSGTIPVVQIHEETETLLLRGTADQIGAVQKALDACIPQDELAPIKEQLVKAQRQYDSDLAKAKDETARRTAELHEARAEADAFRKTVLDLEVAQERLKVQLQALQVQLQATQKKPATKE